MLSLPPPVSAPAVAVRRALTIKQPWAWAIAAGHKRIENRSWPTSFRGHLAIHTGKCPTQKYLRESRAIIRGLGVEPPVAEPARMFSHIVAVARIADCVRLADLPGELVGDPWAFGEWCWLLADVVPLPEPIPCGGGLGLWNLPADIASRLPV